MSNINVSTKACSIGPTVGLFYYVDDSSLVSVNYTGDVVSSYIKANYTNKIEFISVACSSKASFDYDGALVFTVDMNAATVTFRRWVIDLNTLSLKEIKAVTYNKEGYYGLDIRGFSVEKYIRTLSQSISAGLNYIYVNDTTNIKASQECIIGQSTINNYLNNYTFTEVDHVDGNIVYLKDALDNSFDAGDYVTFVGDIFVSSAKGITGCSVPTLYIFDSNYFFVKSSIALYQIKSISCSDFNNDKLYLCSKYGVYFVNVNTLKVSDTLYSYQHCNGNYKNVYGIIVVSSNLFYTLQKEVVTFNNFNCSVETTTNYNLVTNSFLRYINSVQARIGRYIDSTHVNITAKVLDQYAVPIYDIVAKFKTSDSAGSFSVNNVHTNVSGEAHTVYTLGNDLEQTITTYADTTIGWRSSDYVYGSNYIEIQGDVISDGFVSSYGDVNSDVVEKLYDNEFESSGKTALKDQRLSSNGFMWFLQDVESKGIVSSSQSKECSIKVFGEELTVQSEGLVFNSESAYVNDPISDDSVVSNFNFLSYFKPEPYSIKNPTGVVIDLLITPGSCAFDIPSFSFKIRETNNIFNYDSGIVDVTDDGTIETVEISPGMYSIRFVYSPSLLYKFYSRVFCYLNIYDTDSPKNLIKFNCYFDIIEDYIPPSVITTSPTCGSTGVPKDVDIYAVIKDVGTGVNSDTIELVLDGIPVIPTLYTVSGGYSLLYHPAIKFNSGAEVSMNISALDCNDNLMMEACKFYIEDSNAPAVVPEDICGDVVDSRFSFYFDVYDTGGGVKFDTVKLFLDNKDVDIIVRPVIKRIR